MKLYVLFSILALVIGSNIKIALGNDQVSERLDHMERELTNLRKENDDLRIYVQNHNKAIKQLQEAS